MHFAVLEYAPATGNGFMGHLSRMLTRLQIPSGTPNQIKGLAKYISRKRGRLRPSISFSRFFTVPADDHSVRFDDPPDA
jgi:hypothetical protein